MYSALLAASSTTDWSTVLISALGASFIGGVLGGTLTTWLRGRIEREEAWRTRLIDAADDFMRSSSQALLLGGRCLAYFRRHQAPISGDGPTVLTDNEREWIDRMRTANIEARVSAERIGLIFGRESSAGVAAMQTVTALRLTINLLDHPEERPDETDPMAAAEAFFQQATNAAHGFSDAANQRVRGQ